MNRRESIVTLSFILAETTDCVFFVNLLKLSTSTPHMRWLITQIWNFTVQVVHRPHGGARITVNICSITVSIHTYIKLTKEPIRTKNTVCLKFKFTSETVVWQNLTQGSLTSFLHSFQQHVWSSLSKVWVKTAKVKLTQKESLKNYSLFRHNCCEPAAWLIFPLLS